MKHHPRYSYNKAWRETHPKNIENAKIAQRKGGKYDYRKYEGLLRLERGRIRRKHANRWHKYKRNWLTETQIHHEWIGETTEYRGVALVDKSEHKYNIINPIAVLSGEITLRGVV